MLKVTAENYQEYAKRTLIDNPWYELRNRNVPEWITRLASPLLSYVFPFGDRDIMIVWGALGLAGEVAELIEVLHEDYNEIRTRKLNSKEQIMKEVGDICWYLAAICSKIGFSFANVVYAAQNRNASLDPLATELVIYSGQITEQIKKGIFHRHGLNYGSLNLRMQDLIMTLFRVCDYYHIGFEDCLQLNIEKLIARYPEGFSSEASLVRSDVGVNNV